MNIVGPTVVFVHVQPVLVAQYSSVLKRETTVVYI